MSALTYGTFTITGRAPSNHGHACVVASCACGAPPRTVRLTLLRAGKVGCVCTRTSAGGSVSKKRETADLAELRSILQEFEERFLMLEDQVANLARQPLGPQAGVTFGPVKVPLGPQAAPEKFGQLSLAPAPEKCGQMPPAPPTKSWSQLTVPERRHFLRACASTKTRNDAFNVPAPGAVLFTKDEVYAGKGKAEALKANNERIEEILVVPYLERTPELKEELRVRWVELDNQTDLLHQDDPAWPPLHNLRYRANRALEAWHLDPADL